ncbi:MAG: amidohydrolase family protein [Acidimicrobiales bacterium]
MSRMVIKDAEVDGRLVTVVVENDVIVQLSEGLIDEGAAMVDAKGAALLPGLHDHHVHLLAMAARRDGVDVDFCATPIEFDQTLTSACRQTDSQWIRVAGYDDYRHGGLNAVRLDALVGLRKVRVQHRSGLAWILSSAALSSVLLELNDSEVPDGLERDANGKPTGRLLRLDGWLAERVGVQVPPLAVVGAELAAFGITGVTDATPNLGAGRIEILRSAVQTGALPQRLVLLGADEHEIRATDAIDQRWALMGPSKIIVDELSDLQPDRLAETISAHHANGRAVAIHAVSRAETVTATAAFAIAGTIKGDRIEHGSVLPADLDSILANGGVTVIVQPNLVYERGDHYLREVDEGDIASLHRARSLLRAGVNVSVGSDAPVTSADPWAAIAAASSRVTRDGVALGVSEKVEPATALGWYLADPLAPGGPPRRLEVGGPADLCLLDTPLADALAEPDAKHVRMTWVGGRLVYPWPQD